MSLLPQSRPFSLSVICLLMMSLAVHASEEPFRANVRFFNPIADTHDLFFMTQGKDHEIHATFSGPSGRYLYEGASSRLVLYRMSGTGEEAQRTPVAAVTLPETGQDYLVFLLPDHRTGTDRFLTQVFNDGEQNVPEGSTRIYNLSSSPIAIQYGEAQLLVGGGSSGTVNNDKARWTGFGDDIRNRDLPVHIAVKNGERWKAIYRSVWYPREDARNQVFVIPEGKNTMRVVQVSD